MFINIIDNNTDDNMDDKKKKLGELLVVCNWALYLELNK